MPIVIRLMAKTFFSVIIEGIVIDELSMNFGSNKCIPKQPSLFRQVFHFLNLFTFFPLFSTNLTTQAQFAF